MRGNINRGRSREACYPACSTKGCSAQFEYYLQENAPEAAARSLEAVEKAVEQRLEMPSMGAPKALKNSSLAGLRSWPVSGFEEIRVYYRIHEDTLRVIRVLHGRRDTKRILEKESHDVRRH